MKTITLHQYSSSIGVTYRTCFNRFKAGKLENVEKKGRHLVVRIDESFPGYDDLQEFTDVKLRQIFEDKIEDNKNDRDKNCVICESRHSGRGLTCTKICRQRLIKQRFLEKYGVDNPSKSPEIRKKAIETCLKKYGVTHHFRSSDIKEKIRSTCVSRYGVNNYSQTTQCHDSIKETSRTRYGVDHFSQSSSIKEKIAETNISRYGVKCSLSNEEVKRKSIETCRERYNADNPFSSPFVKDKIIATNLSRHGVRCIFQLERCKKAAISKAARDKRKITLKLRKSTKISMIEDCAYEMLKQLFDKVERQVSVESWEIDFYIPEIDTYLNFNGVHWHGKNKSYEALRDSKSKQDKKILETKIRDEKRVSYFQERHMNFAVLWEDDFMKSGIDSITTLLVMKTS